jgi:fucose permease
VLKSSSPDRRTPALLTAFSLLMFFVGFELGGFQLALRSISETFSTGTAGSGFLVAAQYVSIVAMPLLFGRVADRAGKRPILLVFSFVFLAGCLLSALARGVFSFAAGVFCIGAGYSVCESAGSAALSDASPEKGARWINLSQGALSLGAVVSPIAVQYGVNTLGWSWRAVFWLCAAGVSAALAALLFVRFPDRVSPDRHGAAGPSRRLFSSPAFALFFFAILLYVGLENGIGYFTESLFSLKLNAAALGAYAISAYWASMAVSRFVFGVLSLSPQKTLAGCLFASAALFTVLALLRDAVPALALCALIGLAFGPVWSLLMDFAARQHPGSSGRAMGVMSAGCGLGGAVFPALMGLISEYADLRAAFGLLAVAAFIAGALAFAALRLRKER